jgi:hypothetical protein
MVANARKDEPRARSIVAGTRLVKPAALTADRHAACNTVGSIGCSSSRIPPGKEIGRWPGEPSISAQNAEQLRRQHHVAIFRAFAVTDQDHAARAVDVRHSQPRNLRGPESGRIGEV